MLQPESVFTAPRPDCPHPQHWHATDTDSTEIEVTELVAAFARAVQPDVVVETGTAHGATALAIAQALRANGHGHLYTLETDHARAERARGMLLGLPATVVECASLDWQPPPGVGLAWFDSLVPLRVAEFRAYAPAMRPGAIVGFHDCGPHHGTLRADVEALAADGWLRPIYLATPRGVMFAEVIGGG